VKRINERHLGSTKSLTIARVWECLALRVTAPLGFIACIFLAPALMRAQTEARIQRMHNYSHASSGTPVPAEQETGRIPNESGFPSLPNEPPGRGQLTIALRVYDFAHLDPWVLQFAEEVASEIFRQTGIRAAWLTCPAAEQCLAAPGRPEFRLEIVPNISGVAKEDTLGFALPCNIADHVCLSYVLYSPIRALAAHDGTTPSRLLGHVMAHEIGHALLGPNAHAPTGIMRGRLPQLDRGRVLD